MFKFTKSSNGRSLSYEAPTLDTLLEMVVKMRGMDAMGPGPSNDDREREVIASGKALLSSSSENFQ